MEYGASPAAAAALTSDISVWFFSPTPAYFVTWGRYPLLMGAALLPVALLFAISLIEKPNFDGRTLFFVVVTCVGLAFSQIRLTVFYLLFVAMYLAYACSRHSDFQSSLRVLLARIGLAGGVSLLFGVIWLAALFTRRVGWQTILAQNAAAPSIDFSTAIAVALSHHGTELWTLAFLGLIVGLARRSKIALIAFVWYISLCLIAALLLSAISVSLVILIGFLHAALLIGDLVHILVFWGKKVSLSVAELWLAGGIIINLLGAREMVSLINPATAFW